MRILTRKSKLALCQANNVADKLRQYHPSLNIELIKLTTTGDKLLDKPLYKVGGKALFVKELEVGLLENQGDIAVHSLKDVPHTFPEGLGLSSILPREDARDALICPKGYHLQTLPKNSVVGTSSLRRLVQLKSLRPDCVFKPLRGNVDTRLQKCQQGEFDAIVLAYAGLKRLGLEEHITEVLPLDVCLPATGQGAVAIELRDSDTQTHALIQPLHHQETAFRVMAERALSKTLNSSCQTPVACYTEWQGDKLHLTARLGCPTTFKILETKQTGLPEDAVKLGVMAAQDLIDQGGQAILDKIRQHD